MSQLAGKVAIVTGASTGIGAATARLFAAEGARLVIAARRAETLGQVAAEIRAAGGEVIEITGDVRDEALADALVAAATNRFGGLDIAINNAGSIGMMAPAPDIAPAHWRETLETNLTSAFLGVRRQVPAMVAGGGGSIVFTSSFVGHTVGFPGMAAYAAAKAGLVGLAQVVAAEFGAQGVRANAILPGGTDTPMGRGVAETDEARAFVASLHALKRMAEPEEIARAILFLASDASSFMTGAAMLVDGGVSIART